MGKFVVHIVVTLYLVTGTSCGITAADELVSREYKIKAAYLYNLIKFVNWPSSAKKQHKTEPPATKICVYGYNPFSNHLDKLTERTAKGLPIKVTYIDNLQADSKHALPGCHIVFISKSTPLQTSLLQAMSDQPLLTVGGHRNFLDDGGIIGLVVDKNNVQLQINLTQAKKLGFEISGNLLEIAKTVK